MGADFLLHAACMNGDTEKVQQILSEFPGAVKVKDDDGRYPLHWAVSVSYTHLDVYKRQPGNSLNIC